MGFNNPTPRTNSQSPLTAPTRTWSDIVSGNNRDLNTTTRNILLDLQELDLEVIEHYLILILLIPDFKY